MNNGKESRSKVFSKTKIFTCLMFIFLFVLFSCSQTNISRHKARKIGMDTLYKDFGKEEVEVRKPFRLYDTDSTWILSSNYYKFKKGQNKFMKVIIYKSDGKVLKIYAR